MPDSPRSRLRIPAEQDQVIREGLANIYQTGRRSGSTHLEVRRPRNWTRWLTVLTLFGLLLGAIGWLGYIVLESGQGRRASSVALELQAPAELASGDEVTYTLTYRNTESVPVHDVAVMIRYPDGFHFAQATPAPQNESGSAWEIGTISKGGSGVITIAGTLIGEVGSTQSISTTVSYRPENFNSSFKEVVAANTQISSSILDIEIAGPTEFLPEKQGTFTVHYRNTSTRDVGTLKIMAEYPAGFVVQETQPPAYHPLTDARDLQNQWVIGGLQAGQAGDIAIAGGFAKQDAADGPQTLTIRIGFVDENNNFSIQQEKKFATTVIRPGLEFKLIVNGSATSQPVSAGQELTYSVVYKNTGTQDLQDVAVTLALDSAAIDWNNITDKNRGRVADRTITWTKDQISALGVIRPLSGGEIVLTVPLTTAKGGGQVKSRVSGVIGKVGTLEATNIAVSGPELTQPITTDVSLSVQGRYFDDDNIPVGSGPLPPVVGQATTVRVFWRIANSANAIEHATVKAVLPAGVSWTNRSQATTGQISYSSSSRTVSWSLARIAPNASVDQTGVWFDVSVTPTASQVRKLLVLVDQATITGTDTVTGSTITKVGKAVTSNLEDDPAAAGKGLVVDISE